MKILKPGEVEMRRFVCPRCGCIFVASRGENVVRQGSRYPDTAVIACPEQGCNGGIVVWSDGEPYEEPTQDLEADRERLIGLIHEWDTKYFGGCNAAVEFLLENGVTFREE